ncbi:hypothetical protein BBJ28_00022026 [Nothophytophthora sp. Chile5]|nr:hypothetical protein BBJ28_00022026 [Nothophytophthora sp. Chile5]
MGCDRRWFYAAVVGRSTGEFTSCFDVGQQTDGYSNAHCKKFATREEATHYLLHHGVNVKDAGEEAEQNRKFDPRGDYFYTFGGWRVARIFTSLDDVLFRSTLRTKPSSVSQMRVVVTLRTPLYSLTIARGM